MAGRTYAAYEDLHGGSLHYRNHSKNKTRKKKTRPLSIKRKQKRYTDSWVRCAAPTRALPGENGYCRTYVLTEK